MKSIVRLEISPEKWTAYFNEKGSELAIRFRELGFQYCNLNLHGYRTGAMNEAVL